MFRKLFTASLTAALMAGTASADTLREALVSTYQTNPTLMAQRESLKATDATVAIARSAGRPQISGTVGLNRELARSGVLDIGSKGPTLSAGVDLSYPLFNGGSVRNSINAAKIRVEAGRATLRAVEGDVFTLAVAAYMDVIRDRAIVELNANNVRVLGTNLEATRDRFEIGDLTRTDVAQSEARLQLGRSQLATSQGVLTASEATYRQVIGHPPGQLAPPPPLPPLPASAEEAVRIALANNPDLVAAVRLARASGYDVRVAEAGRLPTLSGVLSGTYVNDLAGNTGGLPRSGTSTTAGLNVRVPLYQGGLPSAQIRQAQALEGQSLERVVESERLVVANARSAFATYDAAQRAIQANTIAVQANELALEGVRAEQSVGTRTVLDVLNAEQELLNSQVALVRAKRDAYVAGFQLLNAMGQAEAQDLGLDGGPLYDPLGNYRRVAGDWSDWATDRRHNPVATRTVSPQELPAEPLVTAPLVPAPVETLPVVTPGVTPPRQ
ncbi:MAG TPA: TolC family outer membrane protein [Sphingomicrobium sp.]|nr:TolC family outer membrane protein [Sphingomicrobium sp.]